MRSMALAGFGALVLSASGAHAQLDTVRADGAVRLSLEVGVDSSHTYALRGGERRRIMTYVETISEVPDGFLIVGENVRPDGQSFSIDSLIVSGERLAPIWHSDHSPAGHMDVRYEGGRMRGASDSAGTSRPVDAEVPAGSFDYSMARMIVNQLPLAPGYAGVVMTHDIRRGTVPLPFRVLGEEEITVGGKSSKAWKVEVDLGRAKAVRWIDQLTRRDLRTSITFPGGEMVAEPG
ncbi:MAG TPA: hypothetical protein VFT04_09220 [Gemmatimonadales bacterium]|nr:hypothetical protein [Gemmatimonadales bacterium]